MIFNSPRSKYARLPYPLKTFTQDFARLLTSRQMASLSLDDARQHRHQARCSHPLALILQIESNCRWKICKTSPSLSALRKTCKEKQQHLHCHQTIKRIASHREENNQVNRRRRRLQNLWRVGEKNVKQSISKRWFFIFGFRCASEKLKNLQFVGATICADGATFVTTEYSDFIAIEF